MIFEAKLVDPGGDLTVIEAPEKIKAYFGDDFAGYPLIGVRHPQGRSRPSYCRRAGVSMAVSENGSAWVFVDTNLDSFLASAKARALLFGDRGENRFAPGSLGEECWRLAGGKAI